LTNFYANILEQTCSELAPFPMPKAGHVTGTDRWEVEEILDYRLSPAIHSPSIAEPDAKRMVYFVIKWAHYDEDELTLEDEKV
jgi:hypothetical protein